MSDTAKRVFQVGMEAQAAKGTKVAATRVWEGAGKIQDSSPAPSMREEERGIYDASAHAEAGIEDFEWSYEGGLDVEDAVEMCRMAITRVNSGTVLY